jgi:hypothetical protein
MVKIPNLEDLKKAGANLMDSAKSGTLVDKIKTGVENIGVSLAKGEGGTKSSDPIVIQFETVQATLAELVQAHSTQSKLINQAQMQLATLTKTVATLQALQTQSAVVGATTPEKKE